MLHTTMTNTSNHYESNVREDLVRLAVTALLVIGFLVLATTIQARTGFMNVLLGQALSQAEAPGMADTTQAE